MARGTSGRIVIEIDPETKQELYNQLEKENSNLKAWFLTHVENFLKGKEQFTLGFTRPSASIVTLKVKKHEI
ncbi:hypothetical protein SAMN02745130_00041 [Thiothrix eikelboomii]|uniref:Uncharacterized protein n=1 Tax=Thiothrix eikelboomii TaxID=92487 RepID=A0A1T4VRA7_9GAMM|nr:hypothetical protein [Thiothrix eikelboomii]SKA67496.1 hypothetical protein SAMN02745130_00041 [Thiothrix eikelboomii]